MRDLFSNIKCIRALSPVSVADNTPAVSQIIDTRGAESLVFVIGTGSLADADATFTVLVEESDASNMSGANAVADIDLNGLESGASFTFAEDDKVTKIGYVGNKRYVRLTITPANNTGAALIDVHAILGTLGQRPETAQRP